MPSFEIPDGPTAVPLMSQSVKGKAMRLATVSFTVTNKSDQTLSCRLKVAPQADAQADWFDLQGEKERPFAPAETQKVTVNVAVPAEVAPGDFKFRLQAMNVNDPGNDYAESAVATLSIAKPSPKPSAVWPYILVAVVLVLIVGGVGAYLVFSKKPVPPVVTTVAVPNVSGVGMQYADASNALSADHFTVSRTAGAPLGNQPETVMSQFPPGGAQVNTPTTAAPVPVTLTVDPGVRIPSNLVGTPINSAEPALTQFQVKVNELGDGGADQTIASFVPASGMVKLNTPLTVNVHSPHCPFSRCYLVSNMPISAFISSERERYAKDMELGIPNGHLP